MNTYHVNPETGRANICRAETPASCPLNKDGDAFHTQNKDDAKKRGAELLEKKHGALGKTAKKSDTRPAKKNSKNDKTSALEKEVEELREAKKKATSPEEIKKINGAIRGKSIHIAKAKRAAAEEKIKESRIHRPKVEDIPNNSIKFVASEKTVPTLKKTAPPAVHEKEEMAKVLSSDLSITEKKDALKTFLSSDSREKVEKELVEQGYSLENSRFLKAVYDDEHGISPVLRQAVKESNANNETRTSDVLIRAEDIYNEQNVSLYNDRFSEFDSSERTFDVDDIEIDEEAPDFLAEDPDFAIDDEEEFEED